MKKLDCDQTRCVLKRKCVLFNKPTLKVMFTILVQYIYIFKNVMPFIIWISINNFFGKLFKYIFFFKYITYLKCIIQKVSIFVLVYVYCSLLSIFLTTHMFKSSLKVWNTVQCSLMRYNDMTLVLSSIISSGFLGPRLQSQKHPYTPLHCNELCWTHFT